MVTETQVGRELAEAAIVDLLARDYMLYEVGEVRALHYAEVCAAMAAARIGGTEDVRALARRYARDRVPENTANHVDANVFGILPLELYLRTGEERQFAWGMDFADGQWRGVPEDGLSTQTRFWIDDVWMIGSLQVQAYRAMGTGAYLDRAALTASAYLAKLQRPNGLFYHGPAAPHFWGRGNGWVAMGLAEILSELPAANRHRSRLVEGFHRMVDTLLNLQGDDGMWRQLLDHSDAWPETSCTGMFGYALSVGLRCGILDGSGVRAARDRAWAGLSAYVRPDGKVREVCAGTGQEDSVEFYLSRPRVVGDMHGQAALLLFAGSL